MPRESDAHAIVVSLMLAAGRPGRRSAYLLHRDWSDGTDGVPRAGRWESRLGVAAERDSDCLVEGPAFSTLPRFVQLRLRQLAAERGAGRIVPLLLIQRYR